MTIGGAVVIMLLAGFIPISELSDMVSIGALSGFLIVALAVPVLRRTKPELHRPFRMPLSPVLPVITAVACLYLMANLDVVTWLRFAAWLALGLLILVAALVIARALRVRPARHDVDDVPEERESVWTWSIAVAASSGFRGP